MVTHSQILGAPGPAGSGAHQWEEHDTHIPTPGKVATLVPADAFTVGTYSVPALPF